MKQGGKREPPVAITREPSASLAECELLFLHRQPIDLARARTEHAGYCAALRAAGLEVVVLPALDALPDAVFVEDTAVVVDELAVLAAPGVPSRAAESEEIVSTLADYRSVHRLATPGGTLEGGDVLRLGRTLYVGRSTRTNDVAIGDLRSLLEPRGYRIRVVPVHGCLHLKTACTYLGNGTVLLNPVWMDDSAFESDGLRIVAVDPGEPWAGNTLLAGQTLLVPVGNPATLRTLRGLRLRPVEVAIGEFQKAKAGLTCLSVVIRQKRVSTPPSSSAADAVRSPARPPAPRRSPRRR